ncbi:hypothetical protein R1sor_011972 [Riccia sorocarpa]|uniref:Uncharacterized protein n=1 Tax=Riccia sorocarpa TaxID=122646 RepID=A0ABD3I3E0_9MARC
MEGCSAQVSSKSQAITSGWQGRGGELKRSPRKSVDVRRGARRNVRCSYSSGSSRSDDGLGGDSRVQQMLVEMVQIQVGKARMNDFVDERSEYMRTIAEEAQRDYNRIAMRTMKNLDETGSRVLRQLDQDAYAIERELRIAKAELEAQQKEFEEYQIRSTYSRNEGLFFKNLYDAPLPLRSKSTRYPPKLKKVTIVATPGRDFTRGYKQILYGSLSLVIVSFIWSSSSAFVAGSMMRVSKFAAYGIIFSVLMTQLAYVKLLAGDLDLEEVEDSTTPDTTPEESSKNDKQN